MSAFAHAIYWLGPEAADEDVTPEIVGSKAYGLWRMAKLGLKTSPAFALPTTLCAAANGDPAHASALVRDALATGMERLEAAVGRRLGDPHEPLLVSVRSGAAKSMPGMLATVLNVGLSPEAVHGVIRETGDPRFAWDCYRRFLQSYACVVHDVRPEPFAAALEQMVISEGVGNESELDGEAFERLCDQYAQLAPFIPSRPLDQLTESTIAVFRSWESAKARDYRRLNSLEGLAGTAVTVQAMVFGNGGYRSGSGVAFTRNPATGTSELYLDFLFDAQGEDVVSGRRTPMDARALAQDLPEALAELKDKAAKLEHALGDVQDIEFTVENGRLYFLQTRSAKRTPRAALRIAVDLVHEGLVTPEVALGRLKDVDLRKVASSRFVDDAEVTSRGTPAASGVVSGRAAFDSAAAKRLAAAAEPVVLIRREPATEDIEGFAVADGILTSVGGRTAHAAVVARQLGKVCIVGCSDLVLQEDRPGAILAGKPLSEGGWVSLDGDTGEVTLGRREIIRAEPIAELEEIERWKRDRRLTS